MHNWTSTVTNNPDRDFELVLELCDEDRNEYVAGIERGDDGELYLLVYRGKKLGHVRIPYLWLIGLRDEAETLPPVGLDNQTES